jgi:hypothetical protein
LFSGAAMRDLACLVDVRPHAVFAALRQAIA